MYLPLTAEQKRRKQSIRNWKRQQQNLIEYCKFAEICKSLYLKDKQKTTDKIIEYSLKTIFEEHDKQDAIEYNLSVLSESVVNFLEL